MYPVEYHSSHIWHCQKKSCGHYVELPTTSCGRQLSLGQSEKCAVVAEIVGAKHDIKFSSSCSLDKAASCTDHMAKETANIKLHPSNFSKDEHFM
jgi:hypothetical protein